MVKKTDSTTARPLTITDKAIHGIKHFPAFLFKMVCIVPLFLFGLWLLFILYFPDVEVSGSIATPEFHEEEDIFKIIMEKKDPVSRDHFHMIDEYVSVHDPNPPPLRGLPWILPTQQGKEGSCPP